MNERFEERKKQLLDYLNEQYREHKPKKWWHNQRPVYKTTWEFSNTGKKYRPEDYQEIIRNDFKGAAFTAAFLFLMCVLMFGPWHPEPPDFFNIVFVLVFFIASMIPALDRRPKLIVNEEGLWTHKWGFTISWDAIVESYIKIDNSGDNTDYELIVHYYNRSTDMFYEACYTLNGLEVSNETLASYIEYWKMKTQKTNML